MTWDALDAHLDAVPGTLSGYVGRLDAAPTWTRLPEAGHYAASTMKVAVLAALHRSAERGGPNLDTPVPVRNDFASALPGAGRFSCNRAYDNDEAVWQRVGGDAPLGWLAERMVVRSSNLATNIVLAHVGLPAVAEIWSLAGARHSVTARGIEDFAAREAGLTNVVTAADLAALLAAVANGADATPAAAGPPGNPPATEALATPAACARMRDVLLAQEHHEGLPEGLPPGTRIAHKGGWVRGIRHGAGVVYPTDAPPYVVVGCTTTTVRPDDGDEEEDGCAVLARISATAWAARHDLLAHD